MWICRYVNLSLCRIVNWLNLTNFNFSQVVISIPTWWIPKNWRLSSGLRPDTQQPETVAAGASGVFSGQGTGVSQLKKSSAPSVYSPPGSDPLYLQQLTTSTLQAKKASIEPRSFLRASVMNTLDPTTIPFIEESTDDVYDEYLPLQMIRN